MAPNAASILMLDEKAAEGHSGSTTERITMYKIVGADGKEYGPISSDQMKQWIAEGRANGQTRVMPEGATEWKTLSQLPEFAAALGAKAGPPPPMQPLPASVGAGPALAQEILARGYDIEIGRCIGRGWDMVTKRFWLTVGAAFIIALINGAVGGIPVIGQALTFVFIGGLQYMFLKLHRGQNAELGDCFSGFSLAFVPLMLFSLVGTILVALATVLCVLPGVYLAVAWFPFTALLIIDKKLDFWEAMEVSRKVVTRHWWLIFGLLLVCALVHLLGVIACCVGAFVAEAVTTGAVVCAYEDIFGGQPGYSFPAPTTPISPIVPATPPAPAMTPPASTPPPA
jgi:hypothetical protein